MPANDSTTRPVGTLARELGLAGLVATAVCTVIGGGINVLTFGIQGKVPGIGPYVPLAFVLGVLPALLVLEIALLGRASSVFWLAAMLIGGAIFVIMWMRARAMGKDLHKVFSTLPEVGEEEESEEL